MRIQGSTVAALAIVTVGFLGWSQFNANSTTQLDQTFKAASHQSHQPNGSA